MGVFKAAPSRVVIKENDLFIWKRFRMYFPLGSQSDALLERKSVAYENDVRAFIFSIRGDFYYIIVLYTEGP